MSGGSTAGRLFEIARALDAPITYFFEGVGQEGPGKIAVHQQMLLEVARNFAEIRNEKHQEALRHLTRALASGCRSAGSGDLSVDEVTGRRAVHQALLTLAASRRP